MRDKLLVLGTLITVGTTIVFTFKDALIAYANTPHSQLLQCAVDLLLVCAVIINAYVWWSEKRARIRGENNLKEKIIPEIVNNIIKQPISELHTKIDNHQQAIKTSINFNQTLLLTMFKSVVGSEPPPPPV